MSATSSSPMILSGDSLMLESSEVHDHSLSAPLRSDKLDTIDELSSHLPVCHGSSDVSRVTTTTSPFNIHSDVLDSVFSTSLDDAEHLQDNSPMFDELDFVIDGAKVNSRDDWVSLFGDGTELPESSGTIVKDEDLDHELLFEEEQRSLSTTGLSSTFDETPSASSSVDTTPVLDTDSLRSKSISKPSRIEKPSKSKKLDRLGVVSFSKKQRAADLKPLDIDDSDPVALKRAKNTEAARRSRARKMERMSQLEAKVEELLNDKEGLEKEVIRLRELLSMNGVNY